MDNEIMEQYLKNVPIEVRLPIMKLANDQNWAVFIALALEEPKYFTELKELFNANPQEIDRVLKSLVAGGLAFRKIRIVKDIGDQRKIYYGSTKLGKRFYNALFDVLVPHGDIQKLPQKIGTHQYIGNMAPISPPAYSGPIMDQKRTAYGKCGVE